MAVVAVFVLDVAAVAAGAVSTGMAAFVAATRDFWSIMVSGSPATPTAPPTSPAASERAAAAVVGPVVTVLISCPQPCS
uniref:Putative secreted peptide n=1 Tax=Anopheles braziliensis TaxID=58242 RepID=A0A2M3ZY43_9DIPT